MMKRLLMMAATALAMLTATAQQTRFCIAQDGKTAPILVDTNDWKGVIRAAQDLGDDVRKVTGTPSEVVETSQFSTFNSQFSILVGTIGKSKLIDQLIKQKKIDVKQVRGQWESYLIDVVDGHLVIVGSDKRGTIYGIYEISQRIGVSPWYWMADAPVVHHDEVYYDAGRIVQPSPKVKYRGIFINDEWPSFGTWCNNHFGGVNAKAYAHIFELLLRPIPAYRYVRKDEGWIFLPDLGRGKGCMGAKDVMKEYPQGGPALEYEVELATPQPSIAIGILPTQDILPARGLRLGVQLDDQPMQVIDARQGIVDTFGEYTKQNLAVSKVLKPLPSRNHLALSGWMNGRPLPRRDEVFDNIRWLEVPLNATPGKHTLKLVMIDPEIVVEQLVVNPDNHHYSYFGKDFWSFQ